MDNHKIRYLFIGAIVLVLLGFFIVWLVSRDEEQAPPEIIRTFDPDTGDEIITVPGKTPEFDPNPGPIVFGSSKLMDTTSITTAQYQMFEFLMVDYARKNVGAEVAAVKFLPNTLKKTASTPNGIPYQYTLQVKTENPEAILDITLNLAGLDRIRALISYPAKPELGTFDSGYLPEQNPNEDDNEPGHDESDI